MRTLSYIAVLAILFFSCSKDVEEAQADMILGAWEQNEPVEGEDFIQSFQYIFHSDRSFDLSRTIINPSTSEVVGYLAKSSGTYDINGNRLTLIESERHIHNDSDRLYSDLEDLEPSESAGGPIQVSFSVDEEQNQLTFQFDPCAINENCISSLTFIRSE
jgi:hypothetical protein